MNLNYGLLPKRILNDDSLHERSKLLKRLNVMHKNIISLFSFFYGWI